MGAVENAFSVPPEIFSATISQLREGVCILDEAQKVVLINQEVSEILGWPQEELVGKELHEFIHQYEVPGTPCQLLQAICTGETLRGHEDFFKRRDGQASPVSCTVSPVKIQAEVVWSALTFQDISARRQKERQQELMLMEADQKEQAVISFKRVFETNVVGLIQGDIQGRILNVNDALLDMLGYTREDLISGEIGWKEITPAEYAPLDEIAVQQLKEFGVFKPYEKQYIRKDGQRIDVLISAVEVEDYTGSAIGIVVNITEKKQVERALKEAEKRFRTMAESSPMMVWLQSREGKTIYANKKQLDYTGTSLEKLARDGWDEYVHPDDLARTYQSLQSALQTRSYFEYEIRIRRADGMFRWYLSSGGPILSEDGELIGIVGSGMDIHDRKVAEEALVRYAKRLEQSNKELEHFATIASHDLQEPLRKVMLFASHVKSLDGTLKEEAKDDLERIQRATGRMQHLINDLLDLSRITRRGQPFQRVDLNEVAEETVAELSYAYKNIRQQVEVTGIMTLEADPGQMHQMMSQLLDNAFKFHKPEKSSFVKINIQPIEGNQCQIMIADDGIGMKLEHLSRIFDTFTRLHGTEYSGTGIGLALVKKIVERHNGSITVESTPGEGSIFTVMLPISQQ